MPDKWAQYEVKPGATPPSTSAPDKWSQYEAPQSSAVPAHENTLKEDMESEIDPETGAPKSIFSGLKAVGILSHHLGKLGTDQANMFKMLGEHGVLKPWQVGLATYPGHALGTIGRIGEGTASPQGAAMAIGSAIPITRIPTAIVGGAMSGKQIYDAGTQSDLPLADRLERGLLGASGLVGSAALVGAGVKPTGAALKTGAGAINNAVIDAPGRASQYGANPGMSMAAEGVTGWRPGTIASRLESPLSVRGQQLSEIYKSPSLKGTTMDVRNVVNDPFSRAISESTDPVTGVSPSPLVRRIGVAKNDIANQFGTDQPKPLESMTPSQVLKMKQNLGKITKLNKAEYSEPINDVRKQVGGGLKSALNEAVPEGAPVNQRLHDLMTADEVLHPQAMNYKAGNIATNATANAVRGVGTNLARGMYKVGNALSPDAPLPTADTMSARPSAVAAKSSAQRPIRGLLPAAPIQLPSQMEPIENVGPTSQPAAKGLPSRGAMGRMQKTYTNASTFERPPVRTIENGQIVEQPGGHAGGGVSSIEELSRPGKNYVVKGGQVTYHGKSFAPESTPSGGAHVTVLPDGTWRVNAGTLGAISRLALKQALK